VQIERAQRLRVLPPYLFKEIDRLREEVRARGVDIIDLGVGDPDLPSPSPVVQAGQKAMADGANHRYPSYAGLMEFRRAVADWYKRRFGIQLDPASQVIGLLGSKEGVAHFPLAFVDPGDVVLYTSPGYPVYRTSAIFAGGEPYALDLKPENGFFPDLEAIPEEVARRAKILFFNYPNNPTSAEAPEGGFERVVDFALKYGIIVCHDAAYTEMSFDGYRAPSFLETPGALECGVELHSLSKTFQMTGWRVGMAVGRAEIVQGLLDIKSNIDSGIFQAVQLAAVAALALSEEEVKRNHDVYRRRRQVCAAGLEKLGLQVWPSRATFYVWARVPSGLTSTEWASRLLQEAGVVVTPGNGFGSAGEGWFRIALSLPEARLAEAVDRMEKLKF